MEWSNVLITLDNRPRVGNRRRSWVHGPSTLNVAMLSLYVPERARDPLVDPAVGAGLPDARPPGFVSHREGYRKVFTKIITAWAGHPGTLGFRYEVPNVVKETEDGKEYRPTVQHQPLVHPST